MHGIPEDIIEQCHRVKSSSSKKSVTPFNNKSQKKLKECFTLSTETVNYPNSMENLLSRCMIEDYFDDSNDNTLPTMLDMSSYSQNLREGEVSN